ncbi:MAG: hypothetical protein RLY61_364 [Candidatus Parcubacteria bacterium]|jgi:hypothetical protein
MGPSQAIELYQKQAIIKQMNKNLTISFVVVTLVTIGSILTYANFNNTSGFTFTNLNQKKLVKGASSDLSLLGSSAFTTPIPSKSIELGSDVSSSFRSRVLESTLAYDKVVSFYKNYFAVEDWTVTTESDSDKFYNLELEKASKTIKITLSKTESDTTLISIHESL